MSRYRKSLPGAWAGRAVTLAIVAASAAAPRLARGQALTFDNRRDVAIPEYATIRIGPWYSTFAISAAGSYRYTRSSGTGTDYVFDGERGGIREDGTEFPIVVALDSRNLVPLSRHSSIDLNLRLGYRYYPMDTQDDEFILTVPDERIAASLSWQYRISRFLQGTVYDRAAWITDFVDTRGLEENNAGRRYERFQNSVGTSMEWLFTPDMDLVADVNRTDVIVTDNRKEFEGQDRVEYREGITYEYNIIQPVVIGARYQTTQRYYDSDARNDTTQEDVTFFARGSDSVGAGIPLTHASTLSVSVGVSASASKSKSDGEDTSPNDTPTAVNGAVKLQTQMTKNLSHTIQYSRGLRGGFNSDFEEYDSWNYQIAYTRAGVDISVFSRYDIVEPTGENENPYETWTSGLTVGYPITDWLTLDGSYTYRKRLNVDPPANPDADAENRSDYYTRTVRVGTSLSIMKEVTLRTYVERYERLSDLNELVFTRDTFQLTAAWSKQF